MLMGYSDCLGPKWNRDSILSHGPPAEAARGDFIQSANFVLIVAIDET